MFDCYESMFLDHWVIVNVQICVCILFVWNLWMEGIRLRWCFYVYRSCTEFIFFGCFVIDHSFDICRERLLKKMKGMMYQMVAVLTPSLRRLNACTWCVIWLSCHKSFFFVNWRGRLIWRILSVSIRRSVDCYAYIWLLRKYGLE